MGLGKKTLFACAAIVCFLGAMLVVYSHYFGPVSADTTTQSFVISPNESLAEIAGRLEAAGLVRSALAFHFVFATDLGLREVRPGGYQIAPDMDVLTIASKLTQSPYLAWITIPPGLRKEQIANILAADLSWTDDEKSEWIATDTDPSPSYEEGVYYPDTYLVPSDQTPAQVAEQLRERFVEAFEPYANEAAAENVPWTKILTLASLIEREAAGPDMKLISGILWNRLNKNMALQVDASLQYVKGNSANWWPVVHSQDKYLDSPFNTYEHTGLPPHPIAEPSLAAIDAALNPEKTSCLYYLHDDDGQIHCSPNYAGQLANVNKYLK